MSSSFTCPGEPHSGWHDSWEPRDRCSSRDRRYFLPSLSPPPDSPQCPITDLRGLSTWDSGGRQPGSPRPGPTRTHVTATGPVITLPAPGTPWGLERHGRRFIYSTQGSHALGCSGPGSARFPASRWAQQASPPARNSLAGHGQEVGAKAEEKAHWGSLEGACGSPGPAPAVRACAGEGPHARSNIHPDTTALFPALGGQPWAPGIPGSEPRPPASSWGHSVKPRPSAGPGPSDQTPETGPSQLQKHASPHPEAGRPRSGAVWSGLCEGPLWLRMLPPRESRWRPFNKGTKPVPEGPTS